MTVRLKEQHISETEEAIKLVVNKLNTIYGFEMPCPNYFFDITGATAGKASYPSNTLHFNARVALKDWNEFIKDTIPHEICHIAVWHLSTFKKERFPKNPHGALWNLLMRQVGCKPRRTHKIDVEGLMKSRPVYEYDCGCEEKVVVGARTHSMIKNKKASYSCVKCGKSLTNGLRKITIGFSSESPNGTTKVREED